MREGEKKACACTQAHASDQVSGNFMMNANHGYADNDNADNG